jgi:CRISPR-associated protein Cmx8
MADTIDLTYDLFSLPSAQHRAGLAGLVVAIDTMRKRGLVDVPDLTYDAYTARISLTRLGLTALFNDLYEATNEESRSERQRRSGKPLRTDVEMHKDEKTGAEHPRTVFVYSDLVPRLPSLKSMGVPDPWLKLWWDAVRHTVRVKPTTHNPFKDRAAKHDVRVAQALWKDLQKEETAKEPYVTEVSGSLYIGAQERNAERVPFMGRPKHNLLLHFWPLVTGLGEARTVTIDHASVKEDVIGYVFSVPDVEDVEGFVDEFHATASTMTADLAGYRPRDSILSLPEEGGLRYLNNLLEVAQSKAHAGSVKFTVSAIEVFLMKRAGDNMVMLGSSRVPARQNLVEQYDGIRREYRDLLFRGQLIRNLLRDEPWYSGFDKVFAKHDKDHFFGEPGRWFTQDVNRKFQIDSSPSRGR